MMESIVSGIRILLVSLLLSSCQVKQPTHYCDNWVESTDYVCGPKLGFDGEFGLQCGLETTRHCTCWKKVTPELNKDAPCDGNR